MYRAFVTDYMTPIHLMFSARHLKRGRLIRIWNILLTTSTPIKSSLVYYSDLYVNIEPVSSENLETVCAVLSQAYADTSEVVKNIPYGVIVVLTYREPTWPENQSCLIRIDSFYLSGFDTNTETFEKYILDEVSKYQKRLQ